MDISIKSAHIVIFTKSQEIYLHNIVVLSLVFFINILIFLMYRGHSIKYYSNIKH